MKHESDVVIVGAGIAGLALGVALARSGIRVDVLEAGDRPGPVQSGLDLNGWDRRVSALTPKSIAFLDRLGVWGRISSQRTGRYTRMQVWDADGTGQIEFSASEESVPELGHIVENRLTIEALQAAAEMTPGLQLHWSTRLADLRHDGMTPALEAEDGQPFQAPLLVGADGARSRLRELMGAETRRWSYGQQAIVATVELTGSHQETCWQAFLPTGPLALLPLAEERLCSIVWSLDDDACEGILNTDDEHFIDALNRALSGSSLSVAGVGDRAVFPLVQCHAVDYVAEGIALVADAAHSIHPLAGQGINLGLSDVAVLADVLIEAWGQDLPLGSERVLRRYQRQRKGENLAMMAAMEAFKRGFGSDQPLLRVLRNAGLNWVDAQAPIKRWFVTQALGSRA